MPSLFKTMAFQLKTERLELSMWEESDSVWLSKLIGERGVDIPAVDSVRNRLIEMRKKADENGISLLTIRRRDEGDFIGYCGLIIGRSTLEEPEIAYELFRSAHGKGYATEGRICCTGRGDCYWAPKTLVDCRCLEYRFPPGTRKNRI